MRFFDTNILLYLGSDDTRKAAITEELVETGGAISVQVLNEFVSVARRKLLFSWPAISGILLPVRCACHVLPLTLQSHDRAIHISERYKIPIYDATIVAAALEGGCSTLLTEDFQHGQLLERSLRVCNPFVAAA